MLPKVFNIFKKQKNIVILVGNIGSGKTTWIAKNRKKDQIAISRDSLRSMLGGGSYLFQKNTEPLIWGIELELVKQAMILGLNIIVDEVGVNKQNRSRYITLAEYFSYKVIVVEMPRFSMKECVDRRMNEPRKTTRKIWGTVWKKFDELYEKPIKEEGIDDIIKIKRESVCTN